MGFLERLKNKIFSRLAKRLADQNFYKGELNIHPEAYISGCNLNGNIDIDLGSKVYRSHIDGKVHIGKYSSIWGPNIYITSKFSQITIGNFCSVARNVSIQEYNHKYITLSTYHIEHNINQEPIENDLYSNGPIEIGHDVWIGAGAVILSGVKIGNGAVVGANAVVTSDIPPFAIAAGNPAKAIKYRFSKSEIKKIESLKWWEWDSSEIRENKELFNKPETFLQN